MALETFDGEKVRAAFDNAQSEVDTLVAKFQNMQAEAESKLSTSLTDSSAAVTGDLANLARSAFDSMMNTDFSDLNSRIKVFVEEQVAGLVEKYTTLYSAAETTFGSGN